MIYIYVRRCNFVKRGFKDIICICKKSIYFIEIENYVKVFFRSFNNVLF